MIDYTIIILGGKAMELFWIIVGGALLCGGVGTIWNKKNKK